MKKMRKIMYYPGCTIKTYGQRYEKTAIAAAKALGFELIELPRWNCCGVVYGLSEDSVFHHIAPTRNLIRAQEFSRELETNDLTTLCSMCYHVLKRVNDYLRSNPEALEKLNKFMDDEEDYEGGINVVHYLTILRDDIGFDKISEKVRRRLNGAKVACYYGCMLVKPRETGIDDPEDPLIMDELMESLGAEAIDYPFKTECCGAYHIVSDKEIVKKRAVKIIKAALDRGAEIIATTCPLCHYNLEKGMEMAGKELRRKVLLVYFTELLAFALGLDDSLEKNVLKELKRLIGGEK